MSNIDLQPFFARQYLRFIDHSKFIGVAGDLGKTTAILAGEAILAQKFATFSGQEISKTILKSGKHQKVFIKLLDPKMLESIKLQYLIVTRCYQDFNQDTIKILESIPKKGLVILNWDDLASRKILDKGEAEVFFYGTDPKNCHLWADNLKVNNFQAVFELNFGVERVEITAKILGLHQIYPLLAASALAVNLGFSLINIKQGLEKFEPIEHDFMPVNGHNGSIIIDDTSNSSGYGLLDGLESLNHISAKRRLVVIGQLDLNDENKEAVYKEIARKLYKDKIDLVFLQGLDAKMIEDEMDKLGFIPERIQSGLQNPQIVSQLLRLLSKGDLVLIKGKSANRFDEVLKKISKH